MISEESLKKKLKEIEWPYYLVEVGSTMKPSFLEPKITKNKKGYTSVDVSHEAPYDSPIIVDDGAEVETETCLTKIGEYPKVFLRSHKIKFLNGEVIFLKDGSGNILLPSNLPEEVLTKHLNMPCKIMGTMEYLEAKIG